MSEQESTLGKPCANPNGNPRCTGTLRHGNKTGICRSCAQMARHLRDDVGSGSRVVSLGLPRTPAPPATIPTRSDGLPLAAINALIEAAHRTHDVTFKIEGRAAVIIIEPQDAESHPLLWRRAENLE